MNIVTTYEQEAQMTYFSPAQRYILVALFFAVVLAATVAATISLVGPTLSS